ncbi:hypothetical protein OG223_28100 [Streptomyces sp. NBC_01478]|uniref:hypothetical protein n=1 Tax=Streptomyces sp. NBC_01478 TaxID=2903882 RepID=UPI002E2EFED4|nr:hypothetical protein [Streptomyces sp. NBC_01478]
MSDRARWIGWIGAAAWFAVWWCLVTVVFRLFGLLIADYKSWTTCAGMAAASVVTGELSERWRQRRRKTKSPVSPSTAPGTGLTTSTPDPAGRSGESR